MPTSAKLVGEGPDALTLKELKYVECYLDNGGNAAQAALSAGYRYDMGVKLRKRVGIQRYIKKRVQEIVKQTQSNVDWKIKKLMTVAENCMPDNLEEIEKKSKLYREIINPNATVSAIAELNKMQGHHAAVKNQNINLNVDEEKENVSNLIAKYQRDY